MADIGKLSRLLLGMGALASMGNGVKDVYGFHNPYHDLPHIDLGVGRTKRRPKDEKAFSKKVEKRRKKNRNKKTHRR